MDPIRNPIVRTQSPQIDNGPVTNPDTNPVQTQIRNTGKADIPAQNDDQPEPAQSLIGRLKTMIENAAERNIASLDAKTLRTATAPFLKQLQDEIDGIKGTNDRKTFLKTMHKAMGEEVNALCEKARTTFAALGKLKGSDIAEAFRCVKVEQSNDKIDKTTDPAHYTYTLDETITTANAKRSDRLLAIAKTVIDAFDAQQKLGDHLAMLYRKTGSDKDSLLTMSTACLARAAEIYSLKTDLADPNEEQKSDEDVRKRETLLHTRVSRLLPQFATKMHGNDLVMNQMEGDLKPIAEAIDVMKERLAGGAEASPVDADTIRTLNDKLKTVREALETAGRDGIPYEESKSGKFIIEASVLNAIRAHIVKLQNDLDVLTQSTIQTSAERLVDDIFPDLKQLSGLDGTDETLFDSLGILDHKKKNNIKACLEELSQLTKNAKTIFTNYINNCGINDPLAKFKIELAKLRGIIKTLCPTLSILNHAANLLRGDTNLSDVDLHVITKIRGVVVQLDNDSRLKDKLFELVDKGAFAPYFRYEKDGDAYKILDLVKPRLQILLKTLRSRDKPLLLTDKLLAGLLNGDFGADTYVGVKSWGLPDEMVNPHLDDEALVTSKQLGSGMNNTVTLCTYRMPDGNESSYVFKPEFLGRLALDNMLLSEGGTNNGNTYLHEQTVAQLNFASWKAAEMLGNAPLMPKAYAGMHDGHFGLFMSLAPGKSPKELEETVLKSRHETLTPDTTSNAFRKLKARQLNPEEKQTLIGSLARETTELEWCDLISGQGDRHGSNYKISVNKDYEATVTGIDNDTSFPSWRLGARHFIAGGLHATMLQDLVKAELKINLANYLPGSTIANLPFVTILGNNCYEIDITELRPSDRELAAKICRVCFGLNKAAIPKFVSKKTFNALKLLQDMTDDALKDHFIRTLGVKLSEEQLKACISRTRDAWQHAERLQKAGRMKDKETDWTSDKTYQQIQEDVKEAGSDEGEYARKILHSFLESDILCPLEIF